MTLRDYLVNAIVGATILAAGASIVNLKIADGTQDYRITRIEKLDAKMDTLSDHLQSVDLKLERLNGRLEGEHESRN